MFFIMDKMLNVTSLKREELLLEISHDKILSKQWINFYIIALTQGIWYIIKLGNRKKLVLFFLLLYTW